MLKKISARFSDLDSAETAARAVRSSVGNVKDIVLKTVSDENYIGSPDLVDLSISAAPNFYDSIFNQYSNSFLAAEGLYHSEPNNEIAQRHETWAEVSCEPEDVSAVVNLLRSSGGQAIQSVI